MNGYAKEEKSKRKTYKGQGRRLQAKILLSISIIYIEKDKKALKLHIKQ